MWYSTDSEILHKMKKHFFSTQKKGQKNLYAFIFSLRILYKDLKGNILQGIVYKD